CLAGLPVSKTISCPPISTDTVATRPVPVLVLIPSPSILCLAFVSGRWRFERASKRPELAQTSTSRGADAVGLATQAELPDEGAVPLDVFPLQVVEETPPPPDETQQPAPRIVILRVPPEVLGEVADPPR